MTDVLGSAFPIGSPRGPTSDLLGGVLDGLREDVKAAVLDALRQELDGMRRELIAQVRADQSTMRAELQQLVLAQAPPHVTVAPAPAPNVHVDAVASVPDVVVHVPEAKPDPPRSLRVERDNDGQITRVVQE